MTKNVVVWQWCRGVPERQGNIMALSDEWWCPYLANENTIIEDAFKSDLTNVHIELPVCGLRTIRFTPGQMFASQLDEVNHKNRTIRRVIKTVSEVKVMIGRMSTPPVDISELVNTLPDGTVPHHFFCCITQDIMKDPVKTVDGHTYDRPAISHWFTTHSTSPLTGLSLASKTLTPHNDLRIQIETFIAQHVQT